ncbi:MAG TPA: serine hydrolase domain-containing protein [Sphingomicrobium sp.]|nr:serine hydrolase domain-containing protein [Sphingomicrobium sp.]
MRKAAAFIAAILGIGSLSVAVARTTQPSLVPTARVQAAQAPTPPTTPPDQGAHALTADDVNAWLDGFIPIAIARGDIPGAVVVVVKDGQVLTERGYGYSNVDKKTKVDPKTTMFRPGSISKLFTWTALMQQVEQGKVDLNADVNKYIDFKIPPYQGKPITVLNLMTHTPGFEEQVKDLITLGEKTQVPYDKLLKRWVPRRIYAPGTTPAYSNYGASLAGYIVQRTSGEPFDAYLEHHIFSPLGMQHSTFRQPLPANLKPLMAEGYISGKDKPYGFEFVNAAPAGALAATGDDMAKFMIAHLQNGQFNGQSILEPQTAQLMHSRANSPFSAGDGMAHGFYETNINGLHVIAHGGDTVAFHSDLHLFLDKGVGIFVSFNSAGKEGAAQPLRDTLFANFADRYFPEAPNAVKADPNNAKEDAKKLAGVYSTTRGSVSNFLAIADLIGQAKVGVDKDGNPLIDAAKGLGGHPRKWIHVGPMTWRDADGHDLLTAKVVDGKAVRLSWGELAPIIDFDRTPGYRSSAWILPVLYCSLAVLLLTGLLWPTRALVRRKYKGEFGHEGRQLWAYRSSRIAAWAILAVLLGWVLAVQALFGDLGNEASMNAILVLLQLLSIIVWIGGFAVMLWYAYTVWRNRWRWPGKVWSILLVIAAGMVLYVGLVFKLVALTTNY